MTEFNPGHTDLLTDTDKLLRKIAALYDFFSSDNRYTKQIPFHHQKLSAAKSAIEEANYKKFSFDSHASSRFEQELNELRTLLTDSEKYLGEIILEIEKVTGKKIRFRSELRQSLR